MMSLPAFSQKQILFVFIEEGECIAFKNDNIIIRDKENKIKHQSTCYLLFALFISGHLCITSGLVERADKFGFSIVLMTPTMRVYKIISFGAEGNVLLRRKQYSYSGLDIASRILANKINSQNAVLKHIRDKDDLIIKAIEELEVYSEKLQNRDLTLNEMMGLEGISAKQYFNALFSKHGWTARRPRVKHDMTNCLMDIGYTILFNIINALLEMYGFDTYVGVLHREFFQRKSLTCDFVEPFRPIIDFRLYKSLNLGRYHEEDFSKKSGHYFVGGKKAAPYISDFVSSILEEKESIFTYIQNYYRCFVRDKPLNEYPVFTLKLGAE